MTQKDQYAHEWQDIEQRQPLPQPLLPEMAKPTPYPLQAFTDLLQGAVQAIAQHEQVPPAIAGQCVIGAACYLAQTRVNAWHPKGKPGGAPCSLWMLSLAGSGDGKSSARKLAFKIIDEAEREARTQHRRDCLEITSVADAMKGRKREEYLVAHPLPPDPQTQYSDMTFEPLVGAFIRGKPAACWDTDEGGQALGGSSMKADTVAATLGGLTKCFDDGHLERTRSRGNLEGSGVAYNRRLSIHLLAQPVAVAKALADPLMTGQGFLARFLFAAPDSLAGTRLLTVEALERSSYADPRLQRYWEQCQRLAASPEHIDLATGEVRPPVLDLDTAARRHWVDFRNRLEGQKGILGLYASLIPFANRGAEQALRLAAVLAFFEGLAQINLDCMQRACQLAEYSLHEWLRYTAAGVTDPLHREADALMTWMLYPKRTPHWRTFDKNKAGKTWPPHCRPAQKRDKLLAVLVKHKQILTTNQRDYRINPHLIAAESAESAENRQSCGLPAAEHLRMPAESAHQTNSHTDLPQLSARHPHPAGQQWWELPQNPQIPQTGQASCEGEL